MTTRPKTGKLYSRIRPELDHRPAVAGGGERVRHPSVDAGHMLPGGPEPTPSIYAGKMIPSRRK